MARAYPLGLWTLVLLASPAAAQPKPPRLDTYGDPLPNGALLRIGSTRLQTGGRIGDLAFSRDGKHIVAASRTMGVFVWDVASGKELRHLPPLPTSRFEIEPRPTDRFVGRVLAPGGKYEAEVDKKSVLTLKEVATGREIITSRSELFQVDARRIQFSANGKTLAVMRFGVTNEGGIPYSRYEVASGKLLRSKAVVRLSPGGTHVAEMSNLGLIRLRAVASGREITFDKKAWEVARQIQFASIGKTLAVMDAATSTVHLYEVATGRLLGSQAFKLEADTYWPPAIGIASDGRMVTLALVDHNSDLYFYDVNTRRRFVAQGQGGFGSGAFSPDAKLLATGPNLFDVATRKRVAIKGVRCGDLRFTADGRRLAVLADNFKGVVKVFDVATGRLVQTSTQGGPVALIAVSPDGKYLAGADGGPDGKRYGPANGAAVRLWHADTGQPVHRFANPPATFLTVKFAPNGKSITALSHPRYTAGTSAWVWDAADGKLQRHVVGDARSGRPVSTISADGKVMANTSPGEKLLVTDVATGKILMQGAAVPEMREPLLLSPDGKYLLAHCSRSNSTSSLYAVHFWEVASGKKMLETEWRPSHLRYGYLDGSGRILVVVRRPGDEEQPTEVTCHDLPTGRQLPHGSLMLTTPKDPNWSPHLMPMISPDGRLLVVAPDYGGPLQVRELATGQVVGSLPDRGQVVSSSLAYLFSNNDQFAFAPNGRLLAAATRAGAILVWDLATSQVVAELQGHRGTVTSVSWSSDGKRLVSSGQDMTLLVWDAAPWWARVEKSDQSLAPAALQPLWRDLASDQAKRGYDAVWQLARAPKQAVALLRQHLPGAGSGAAAKVRALLADLGSAKFAVREKAYAELDKLGDLALAGLEKALTGSQEVRKRAEQLLQKLEQGPLPAAVRQQLRALKVLESIGTVEAQALLKELASEDVYGWLTREARLALPRRH